MIKLIVASGESARELSLDDISILIGRTAECQVRIDESRVSRQHAKIEKSGGQWLCSDLGSGNGTKVNDVVVTEPRPLRRGDTIMIGQNLVTIADMDVPDPPPSSIAIPVVPAKAAAHEPEPAEAAPSPLGRVFTYALMGGAGIAAVVLIVAVAVSSSRRSPTPEPTTAVTTSPRDRELAEAEGALEKLRAKIAAADSIGDDLVAEAKKLGAAYNGILKSRQGNAAAPPFDQLLSTLLTKQAEQRSGRATKLTQNVDQALAARKYAEAVGLLRDSRSTPDATDDETVRVLIERVDRVMDDDMARVRRKGESLESYEQYGEAADHYRSQQSRFRGTKYEAVFTGRPELLGEMARLAAIPRKPRVTPTIEPSAPETGGLISMIIPPIAGGALSKQVFAFSSEIKGLPTSADKSGVTVSRGEGTLVIAWPSVPGPVLFAMASLVLKGSDLLQVAELGYTLKLRFESDRLLWKLISADPSQKSRAYALIAKGRGKPAPKDGYRFHAARGWEEPEEREGREAEIEAQFLVAVIDEAETVKLLDPIIARLAKLVAGETIPAASKHRIEVDAVKALKASKDAHVKVLAEKSKGINGSFERLRAAKRKLNQAREAALKLIYDESKYLREDDHPRFEQGDEINGQAAVDKLVDEVRKLWDSAGTVVATMDPAMKREVELLQAINERYLVALGDPPDEGDLKDYEEVMSNLNSKINLKTFCANSAEAQRYAWNRKCEQYNQALKDPSVGDSEKQAADIINDYREMMGRQCMFLDARICRATKKHSAACSAAGSIWHVGSDGDPSSRAAAEGFPAGVGENVCLGYADSDTWTRGWYRASDHHRNGLLEMYNCFGYGYSGNVGTQAFATIGAPF